MSEENKRVVRRYFEELDRRKATPVDLCADRFTFYVAGFPPMDLEATKQFAAMFFDALPDLSQTRWRIFCGAGPVRQQKWPRRRPDSEPAQNTPAPDK